MAIYRLTIACPGCGEGVTLRVAIGVESDQHFYFICPRCASPTRGCLGTDQEAGEVTGLDLDGQPAKVLKTDTRNVVNVSTDFPMDGSATSEESIAGSGFMMHGANLGGQFHTWREQTSEFNLLAESAWNDLRRWWGFYAREDWARFDAVAQDLFKDAWPQDPPMIARHDSIHRMLDIAFVPLFADGSYVRWKTAVFRDVQVVGTDPAVGFVRSWTKPERLREARHRLFDVLDQFVAQRHQWRPGQLWNEYRVAKVPFGETWRLMRDDFRPLRDLFNTTFERSHQYLPVLIGFHNAHVAGDQSLFPDGSRCSVAKLTRGTAVERGRALRKIPPWGLEVETMLNRDLRNAIGHGEAIHDLSSGTITWPKGSIPYPEFAAIVAASAQAPLLLLNTLKYVSIMHDLSGDDV